MADTQQITKCPICGKDADGSATYCGSCGWEFKQILNSNSAYNAQEQKRLNVAQQYIQALISKKENTIAKIATETKNLESLSNQIGEMDNKLSDKDKTIQSLKADIEKINSQNEDLKREIETSNAELDKIQSQCQESMYNMSALVGIVYIKNLKNDMEWIAPVCKGDNTYGSGASHDSHRQIAMRLRGIKMPELLFKVSDGFVLYDLSGGLLSCDSGNDLSKGAQIAQTPVFFKNNGENILEINVVQL